jgi:hypothetical protein
VFSTYRGPPTSGQHERYYFLFFTVPFYELQSMLSPDVGFDVDYTSHLTMKS